jgi:hypothetical protein
MHSLNRTLLSLSFVVTAGLAACSSTVSDAGLTTTTGGGCAGGCPSGEVCQNNHCVSSCAASGSTLCGTICVNTETDNANCGACGMACASGKACSAGQCAATCAQGYSVCTTDAGFYCAVLAGDLNNCGMCGNVCGTGKYCSMGSCTSSSVGCPQGLTLCGPADAGTCVNLESDNNNCGHCGKACSAGESCLAASCQSGAACPNGLLPCPNATGGTTCVAYLIDPANCGACNQSCGANGVCSQGICGCPGLYSQCGTASAPSCAALQFDAKNCGSCGHACVTCESCTLGACAPEAFLTASPPGIPAVDGGGAYGAVVIADFNGDGVNDLATFSGTTSVLVFFGADGGLGSYTSMPVNGAGFGNPAIVAADFNGDGVTDLAVAYIALTGTYTYSAELVVFLGSADAGFSTLGPFGMAMNTYSINGLATGDFNADTFQDIAVIQGFAANGLTVFYGNGAGAFSAVGGLPGDLTGYYLTYSGMTAGDVNADGVSDLVMSYTDYGTTAVSTLRVLFGSDAGIGSANSSQVGVSLLGALAVTGNEIDAFSTGLLLPYVWNSDAGLLSAGTYAIASAPYSSPTAAAAQDMNGDGLVDLLALEGTSVFMWLRNDAGFGSPWSVVAGGGGMAVGDLNGDNRPDVAVTNSSAPGGNIFLNSSNTCK